MNEIQQVLSNPVQMMVTLLVFIVGAKYAFEIYRWYKDRFREKHEDVKHDEQFHEEVSHIACVSQQHTDTLAKFSTAIENLTDEVRAVSHDVKDIRSEIGSDRATDARIRILRMNDEILEGRKHSEETFDQSLSDIDRYERYCLDHPDFKNSKATMAIANIKETYKNLFFKTI